MIDPAPTEDDYRDDYEHEIDAMLASLKNGIEQHTKIVDRLQKDHRKQAEIGLIT